MPASAGSRRPFTHGEPLAGDLGIRKLAAAGGTRAVRDGEPQPPRSADATLSLGSHCARLPLRRSRQCGRLLDRLAPPGAARHRRSVCARGSDRENAPPREEDRCATHLARRSSECNRTCPSLRDRGRRGGAGSRPRRHTGRGRCHSLQRRRRLDLLRRRRGHRRRRAHRERAENARHVSHDDSDGAARPRLHREPGGVSRPAADATAGRRRQSRQLGRFVRVRPPQAQPGRSSAEDTLSPNESPHVSSFSGTLFQL